MPIDNSLTEPSLTQRAVKAYLDREDAAREANEEAMASHQRIADVQLAERRQGFVAALRRKLGYEGRVDGDSVTIEGVEIVHGGGSILIAKAGAETVWIDSLADFGEAVHALMDAAAVAPPPEVEIPGLSAEQLLDLAEKAHADVVDERTERAIDTLEAFLREIGLAESLLDLDSPEFVLPNGLTLSVLGDGAVWGAYEGETMRVDGVAAIGELLALGEASKMAGDQSLTFVAPATSGFVQVAGSRRAFLAPDAEDADPLLEGPALTFAASLAKSADAIAAADKAAKRRAAAMQAAEDLLATDPTPEMAYVKEVLERTRSEGQILDDILAKKGTQP